MGRYQSAVDDFNEAIRLKPDYADAYNNRGGAYFKLRRYQLAVKDFNEAIRLKPDYADAYNNRGGTYFNQGNKKPGCYDAQRACKLGNCIALQWAKKRNYCR
jgi:tetratricopeptide (TPR) repeat protein